MGQILSYSLAVSLLLIPLYLSLRLMLNGLTFHRFYRVMMLSVLVLSFVLPLLVPSLRSWIVSPAVAGTALEIGMPVMMPATGSEAEIVQPHTPLWLQAVLIAYGAGLCLCLLWQTVRVLLLVVFMSRCERAGRYGRWILLVHDRTDMSPFSWGRWIVVNRAEQQRSSETVLCHEKAHLAGCHWLDLLVVSFAGALIWYNPAVWLLRRDLATIHEYEADSAVIDSGADIRAYQIMLIKKAAGNRFHSIANSLDDKSNISKRVKMMLKKSSMPALRLRAALVVPVAALSLVALATPAVANILSEVSDAKVTEVSPADKMPGVKIADAPAEDGKDVKKEVTEEVLSSKTVSVVVVDGKTDSQPLVVVDGKVAGKDALKNISSDAIASITVLKDEESRKHYSEYPDAKNGVLLVSLKKEGETGGGAGAEDVKVVGYGTQKKVSVTNNPDGSVELMTESPTTHVPIVDKADVAPVYPGGDAELMMFVAKNMVYPEEAVKAKKQGTVIVNFIVGPDGRVSNVKVAKPVDDALDREAIRVASLIKFEKPGMVDGKPVAVKYALPIRFKLQK